MRVRKTLGAVVATPVMAASLVLSGAGTAGAIEPNGPPSCKSPAGGGPGYNASIGTKQNGEELCIIKGEKLLVFLSAPLTSKTKWHSIKVSPSGILTAAPLTLMLSRGVTATNFLAARDGTVQLSSERPACAPAANGTATCDAILAWRVTVVVRSVRKPFA